MKPKDSSPVDEQYLQELMAAPSAVPPPAPEDTDRAVVPQGGQSRRRSSQREADAYAEAFLGSRPCQNRQGVYIDRELHAKISVLVGIAGKRNITVGTFIDNVLAHHFEQYAEAIREYCSKKYGKLF